MLETNQKSQKEEWIKRFHGWIHLSLKELKFQFLRIHFSSNLRIEDKTAFRFVRDPNLKLLFYWQANTPESLSQRKKTSVYTLRCWRCPTRHAVTSWTLVWGLNSVICDFFYFPIFSKEPSMEFGVGSLICLDISTFNALPQNQEQDHKYCLFLSSKENTHRYYSKKTIKENTHLSKTRQLKTHPSWFSSIEFWVSSRPTFIS